jgi:hypothetical protein
MRDKRSLISRAAARCWEQRGPLINIVIARSEKIHVWTGFLMMPDFSDYYLKPPQSHRSLYSLNACQPCIPQPAAHHDRVVPQQQPERERRQLHGRVGQVGEQPRALGEPGQKQVGDRRQPLAQRQPDQPAHQRQSTKEHCIWDHGEQDDVGQRRDDREVAEVVEDQGQRQDLGRQGRGKRLAGPVEPAEAQRGLEQHGLCALAIGEERGGGQRAELEAQVPERLGVPDGHGPAGGEDSGPGVGAALEPLPQHDDRAHHRRPDNCRGCADKQGVEPDADQDGPERAAFGDPQALGHGVERGGYDRDVPPRDTIKRC